MFMMVTTIRGIHEIYWPDSRANFDQAFREVVGHGTPAVTDRGVALAGNSEIESNYAAVLFAKNKATLVSCLRRVPLDVTVTVAGGSISYVAHSYDWEKLAGWGRAKIAAIAGWGEFKQTERGQALLQRGGNFSQFAKSKDRQRLLERGYYLGIASDRLMRNRDTHAVHADTIPLNSFAGLLTGRMSREEAVGNLMEDLLIA
jgi:hypothetical protein